MAQCLEHAQPGSWFGSSEDAYFSDFSQLGDRDPQLGDEFQQLATTRDARDQKTTAKLNLKFDKTPIP
jgi:hypothetical protein